MSIEKSNEETVRKAFDLWNETKGQSTDHWLEIMADEVDFRSLADGEMNLEFTKQRKSKEEVKEYLSGLSDLFEMEYYKVKYYIAQNDFVVAVGTTAWRNRQTGAQFKTPKADVIRLEDGKIKAFYEFYDTAKVMGAAAGQSN